MRIALLAPLPPAQTGIAEYANHWRQALQERGVEVLTPLAGVEDTAGEQALRLFDWRGIDLVHAELGGGRGREFMALETLRRTHPAMPCSATVHDPERLIWRSPRALWPLRWIESLPRPAPQIASLLSDPLTLARERKLARSMSGLVTLTRIGAQCLRQRMRLTEDQVHVIAHGNLGLDYQPPLLDGSLRLLYFGFIYPGKGIEDLLEAMAKTLAYAPELRGTVRLTLAGGSAPQLAFGKDGDYLHELQARAEELGLTHALDWRLDLPNEEIPALIRQHHVMVLPYRESRRLALLGQMRGTSGALSWAMACGRGAIVSDARAFSEEVAEGNGSVYPAGDVDALVARIVSVARAPRQIIDWAEQAARIGRERHWSLVALRFRNWFEQLQTEAAHVA